jgi:hypothetical protein
MGGAVPLLGTAEEAQHNSRRGPIIVLMQVGTERSSVIVDIEQAYLEVLGGLDVHATAHLIRNAIG